MIYRIIVIRCATGCSNITASTVRVHCLVESTMFACHGRKKEFVISLARRLGLALLRKTRYTNVEDKHEVFVENEVALPFHVF